MAAYQKLNVYLALSVGEHTLYKACIISSTGVSLNWPFRCLPIAVRFANVITTSSGRFSRIAARPCLACVDMTRNALVDDGRREETNMEDSSEKQRVQDPANFQSHDGRLCGATNAQTNVLMVYSSSLIHHPTLCPPGKATLLMNDATFPKLRETWSLKMIQPMNLVLCEYRGLDNAVVWTTGGLSRLCNDGIVTTSAGVVGEFGCSTCRAVDNVCGNSGQKQITGDTVGRALLVLKPFVGAAHRFSGMGNFTFGYGKDYCGKEVEEWLEDG